MSDPGVVGFGAPSCKPTGFGLDFARDGARGILYRARMMRMSANNATAACAHLA